jgi:hypothetical protein
MSNLPSNGRGGGSAFADFLSRVQPYPPPPGFWIAVLYAVGGAFGLLIAGVFAEALPTGQDLRGNVAIGADEVGAVLEWFRAPGSAFTLGGLLALGSAAAIASRRRLGTAAGGVLAVLPMIGVMAAAWTGIGWLLVLAAYFITLLLWLIVFGLMGLAGFRLLIGDLGGAFVLLVIAFVGVSWLERPTSDSATSSPPTQAVGSPSTGTAAPPGSESPSVSPEVEQQEEEAARRQRQHHRKVQALVQRRIALEARMDSEFAGWEEVPYVPPCGQQERRAELHSLRDIFARMKRTLRYAARHVEADVFRHAGTDLKRMARYRERALANPAASYEESGFCPGGAGATRFIW